MRPEAERVEAVLRAVRRLARHPDPQALSDGLSAPMARHCLELATGLIGREALLRALDVPGRHPRRAAVVAARGVFTAPLEWVALLAGTGASVLLKAPSSAPAFCEAVGEAFRAEGLPVEVTTRRELPPVDALLAMGSDEAVAALAASQPRARLSLHGHRFSLAVVDGRAEPRELARALALDAALYDGRGCFTPVAVVHLGGPGAARELAGELARALDELARELPPGRPEPLLGPERRRRLGLARIRGELLGSPGREVPLLPLEYLEPAALPWLLPVHPARSLEELARRLAPHRAHLAACATVLDEPEPLLEMGFERICRPGRLQAPPFGRPHGGREPLRPLMGFPSVELV